MQHERAHQQNIARRGGARLVLIKTDVRQRAVGNYAQAMTAGRELKGPGILRACVEVNAERQKVCEHLSTRLNEGHTAAKSSSGGHRRRDRHRAILVTGHHPVRVGPLVEKDRVNRECPRAEDGTREFANARLVQETSKRRHALQKRTRRVCPSGSMPYGISELLWVTRGEQASPDHLLDDATPKHEPPFLQFCQHVATSAQPTGVQLPAPERRRLLQPKLASA
jgi:hypothetical protein